MSSLDAVMPVGLKVSGTAKAYCKLVSCAALLAGGEILLKVGADSGQGSGLLGFSAMSQAATWLGIILYIANFVVWLDVLRTTPVGVAYAVQSVVQLMVPVSAFLFLHEQISAGRAFGIVLVFAGVLLAAAPSALADQRL